MNIGIIGCGLIGAKRALCVAPHRVVAVCDVDEAKASALAERIGARVERSAEALQAARDIKVVIIATTHDQLAGLAADALRAGKHVLVEKPGACRPEELEAVRDAALRANRVVRFGYNHRFHPALLQARAIVDSGALGPLIFIRGRYGHGGRIGYEKEWRANEAKSGGGEAIDQGVHLIDLSRWFLGDFPHVQGYAPTYFWKMAVEDNAFMLLRTASGQAAFLHATWTEWKNMFSMEIVGRDGKLQVEGLGGSYGPESLTHYRMLPQMGPPETQRWEYPGSDDSWRIEFEHFVQAISGGDSFCSTLDDAQAALSIAQTVRTFR
ncbi:MAG: Gfo/Idh/MocA family oxidoreductase [Verrucomicrobia bacterium]|nr:Gfo/Idh/MocA family oxidoreductase [Kiritimatiellia bacterium]MCO6399923.1 Gfo/Idh/MocA family oxidoreductase [Verrucomicrobiota bacterium]